MLRRLRIVHVDHARQAIAQTQCRLEGFGQALLDVLARAEAVDHRFDRVLDAQCQLGRIVQLDHLTIDARAHQPLRAQLLEHLHVFALALTDHWGQQHPASLGIQCQGRIDHLADGLCFERKIMFRTARRADPRVQQPQVVVDLGDRADGGARVVRGGFLLDRDRRRQPLDMVQIRLFHHRQELARIRGQRFDIAPLALGIDRVECERGLARAGQAGDHDQPVARQFQIDVLEVVRARAAKADGVHA